MTTIEPMVLGDVDAALGIDLASFPAADIAVGDDPRASRRRQLEEELARVWSRVSVARAASGEVVGYVLFWHVTDEIHLLNVAVSPAARRRGIGRALVEHVRAYAAFHAAAKILLEVRASNVAALAMYDALGFERFNVRRGYYADGEDGVEMILTLDQQRAPLGMQAKWPKQ